MHRTDHPTNAAVLPTPEPAGTPGYFTGGDPLVPIAPTVVDADWANAVQEELANAIEAAGFTLDKGDTSQLAKSLGRIAGGNTNLLINCEGRIRQRLGSATGNLGSSEVIPAGGPDHWRARAGGSGDVGTLNPGSDNSDATTAGWPSRPQSYMRFRKTTDNTSGVNPTLCQFCEDLHFLAGQPVVFAFDAVKNGGLSVTPSGVDIVQDFGSGGSADVTTALTSVGAVTIDGSARRFVFTGTLPTINGKTINPGAHVKVRLKFPTNMLFDLFLSAFVFSRGGVDAGYAPRRKEIDLLHCLRYFEVNKPSSGLNDGCDKGLWDMAFSRTAGDVETLQRRFLVPKFEGAGAITVTWYAHDESANFITEGASTKHAVTSVGGGSGISPGDTGYPRITSPPSSGTLRFFRAFWTVEAEIPD